MCPGMEADSTDLGVPKRRREGKSAPQVEQLLAGLPVKPCWVASMSLLLPLLQGRGPLREGRFCGR